MEKGWNEKDLRKFGEFVSMRQWEMSEEEFFF
jgi:hypothetical protein